MSDEQTEAAGEAAGEEGATSWWRRPMTRREGAALALLFTALVVADLAMTMRNRERRKRMERSVEEVHRIQQRMAQQMRAIERDAREREARRDAPEEGAPRQD